MAVEGKARDMQEAARQLAWAAAWSAPSPPSMRAAP